ncbi:MAG TPA: hypothetical protein VFC45_00235 [Pseudolabrys sp.]|nr:hypothetical protein [Pseudolabrys sp.]
MTNAPLALAMIPPEPLNDDEYRALHDALSESARGLAFLAEFARRNRNADTEALLAAIERIETRLQADASAVQRLRDDLRMLLIAIRLARPEIDGAGPAAKAIKLSALLDLLERRIDAMSEAKPAALAPPDEDSPAAVLAVVPPLDEPELPIPAAVGFEPRPVSIIANAQPRDPLAALMALSEDERLALFT